jgi:23S rRNA (cytosine1962-C5)-methyltransferase
MSDYAKTFLKGGREKPILRRHPWIFSGAVARKPEASPGDIVDVHARDGRFLARGYWNPHSNIRVRLLTWDADERIDADFWRGRLEAAFRGRQNRIKSDAYRIAHAENDGLPGLIVDRYADWLVVQALTLGIDVRKGEIAGILGDLFAPAGIFERSDVDVRSEEGLRACTGPLAGPEPTDRVTITENGLRFHVDVRGGQKTGFYLDQRENRQLLAEVLRTAPKSCDVLNVFGYTGGFAVYAKSAGARRAVTVDSSASALALARANFDLNGLPHDDDEFVEADAFQTLRDLHAAGERFDVIVVDPPKFATSSSKRVVQAATRGYKDANLWAFRLLKPGGLLMTFSCSGPVSADLFQKVIFGAMVDSGRDAQILRWLGPGPDHPVALTFPEGRYLKGLLCRA